MAYIKKEPIIDFITKGLNNPDKAKAFGYDAIQILTEIEYAPTADVEEVKHGWWIYNIKYYSCSVCAGKRFNLLLGTDAEFCPYCGAKMDGRSDNND